MSLHYAGIENAPVPTAAFDGVTAVNCVHPWHPLEKGIAEVARVLRPDGALVTLTHRWAIQKNAALAEWIRDTTNAAGRFGLGMTKTEERWYRTGISVLRCAGRAATDDYHPVLP